MRRVFIDTSAYVALTDRSDQFHEDSTDKLKLLLASKLPQVTTNYILAESYTRIRRKLGHRATVLFGEGIRRIIATRQLEVVYVDTALDEAAWNILKQYPDQPFSFVDCTSFAWLRQNKEVEVFAFDEHFVWMGFTPFEG